MEKIYFAGGCFWGVEYYFQGVEGVIKTAVGYMGGNVDNPTYEQVCNDKTGHAEVLEVEYDSANVSVEGLTKLFFEIHDFTQVNRQGPDIGEQYRTEIFYTNEEQKKVAQNLINQLSEMGYNVATKLTEAGSFYKAEEYHQKYYEKNGKTPYCHIKKEIF